MTTESLKKKNKTNILVNAVKLSTLTECNASME